MCIHLSRVTGSGGLGDYAPAEYGYEQVGCYTNRFDMQERYLSLTGLLRSGSLTCLCRSRGSKRLLIVSEATGIRLCDVGLKPQTCTLPHADGQSLQTCIRPLRIYLRGVRGHPITQPTCMCYVHV